MKNASNSEGVNCLTSRAGFGKSLTQPSCSVLLPLPDRYARGLPQDS